jgi:hypothetical protein
MFSRFVAKRKSNEGQAKFKRVSSKDQTKIKPQESFNRECPICQVEREPYMMETLTKNFTFQPYQKQKEGCYHRACKEHLNSWGWSQNPPTPPDQKVVRTRYDKTLPSRCPFCNQKDMVPRPYLHPTLFVPANNVLKQLTPEQWGSNNVFSLKPEQWEYDRSNNVFSLKPEQWEDDWNDWRWEVYENELRSYTRDDFEKANRGNYNDWNADPFPEYDYLLIIANKVRRLEENRNTHIAGYLQAKRFPNLYGELKPDQEIALKIAIETRRLLRSWGYEPEDALLKSIQIDKGEIKLDSLQPGQSMFSLPISRGSGGGSKRKKRKKGKRNKTNKRK